MSINADYEAFKEEYALTISRTFNGLAATLQDYIGEKSRKALNMKGSYHFIKNDSYPIIRSLYEVKKDILKNGWTYKYPFIDLGSGPGLTLHLAAAVGFTNGLGLDIDSENIKLSKYLLFGTGLKVIKRDILKWNGFGPNQIIYYYCPFIDDDLQHKFEKRVEDRMKVGSYLIAFLKRDCNIDKDPRFQRLNTIGPIWKKVKE